MVQKIIAFLLALVTVATLTGCNKNTDTVEPMEPSVSDTKPVAEAVPTETSEPETSEILATAPAVERVDIAFDFARQPTSASNQLAVWTEDADGNMVKTLLVTSFTAARRGYRNRDMSLTEWVKEADPESMADAEIDAISSATPSTGRLVYSWDMTDANGERVSNGIYKIRIEGTLYWESSVLYTAELNTVDPAGGEMPVTVMRSEPNNADNEAMIENVRVSVTIGE